MNDREEGANNGMGSKWSEIEYDVLAMVLEFMDALEWAFVEEQKLKNIVTMRVNLLRILELVKPMIKEFQMVLDLSNEDVLFCNDY